MLMICCSLCAAHQCENKDLKSDLKVAEVKIKCLERIIGQLEITIHDKQQIITLLNETKGKPHISKKSGVAESREFSLKPLENFQTGSKCTIESSDNQHDKRVELKTGKTTENFRTLEKKVKKNTDDFHAGSSLSEFNYNNDVSTKSKQEIAVQKSEDDLSVQKNNEEWQIVTKKKNKPLRRPLSKVLFTGTSKDSSASKIKGATNRKWLYIGHISGQNVMPDDVKKHLSFLEGIDEVEVKKLPTKGQNSAFSIGVPENMFDKVSKPEVWPFGIIVREFNFKNFFSSRQVIQPVK